MQSATTKAGVDRWTPAYQMHGRAIRAIARENFHKIPGYGMEDLESELLEVLYLACTTYDPDKGTKFNTFWRTLAQRRIATLLRSAFAKKRQGNIYTETLSEEEVAFAVEWMTSEHSAEDEALARIAVVERARIPL